jgi:hypothetical protein
MNANVSELRVSVDVLSINSLVSVFEMPGNVNRIAS